jgi:hypothetical protein
VKAALRRLNDAGLVNCRGSPPQAIFSFKHALVRDAAYECLVRAQRQRLHASVASVLETRFPEVVDQQPELLAQHWTEAGSIEKAIAYWIKAGRKSVDRAALAEGAMQLRKGLALVSSLADTPDRWRQELDLQAALGWALFISQGEGAPEAGQALTRARALCDQLGDQLNDSWIAVWVLYLQAGHLLARAEYPTARAAAGELLRWADQEQSDWALEIGHQTMGRSLHYLGEFAPAVEHFERVLSGRLPDADRHSARRSPQDALRAGARTLALSYSAYDFVMLGHPDTARSRSEQALVLAREGPPYLLAVALSFGVGVDIICGAEQAALKGVEELAAVAIEQRFPFHLAHANLWRAWTLSARVKRAEGLAMKAHT